MLVTYQSGNTETNYLIVRGANSGSGPAIYVAGTVDANVDLSLSGKGTGNVTTSSPLTVTNANVSTSISTGALIVSGGAGISGNLNVGTNLIVNNGNAFVRSSATQQANVVVTSDVTGFTITTAVSEPALGSMAIGFGSNTNPSSYMVLAANGGKNYIDTRNRDFYIQDNTAFQPFYISQSTGNILVNGTTPSTSTTTGALTIKGGVGIAGDVYSGGNYYIGSNTRAVPTIYYSNSATGQYSALLVQRAGTELWLAGASPSENYVIRNNASLDAVTVANVTGNVIVNSTTTSTSTTTGALVVKGGVGVAGNLIVGGNLTVLGNITTLNYETVLYTETANVLNVTGNLSVAGAIASNVTAYGNVYAVGLNSRVGMTWANATSSAYTVFNAAVNSVDLIFG
jgi:hypothetical protein